MFFSVSRLVLFCSLLSNLDWITKCNAEDTTCSSTQAYVDISFPSDLVTTLLSAQAYFAPYNYPTIDVTTVSLLDSSTEDGCNTITTDLTDTVALIWNTGNCSDQLKTLNAQAAGAVAVLIARDSDLDFVSQLTGDSNLDDPTIPARQITQQDGWNIEAEINTPNKTVEVLFACFSDSDYPTAICVEDYDGLHWPMDGDYERQSATYNDHPVYKKEAYSDVFDDMYVWLYTPLDYYWIWVMSGTIGDYNGRAAYCVDAAMDDPTYCAQWKTYNSTHEVYSVESNFKVITGLCELTDNYICIDSLDDEMESWIGSYRQLHDGYPLWVKEMEHSTQEESYLTWGSWTECSFSDGTRRRLRGGGGGGGGHPPGGGDEPPTRECTGWYGFELFNDIGTEEAYCNFNTQEVEAEKFTPYDCTDWNVLIYGTSARTSDSFSVDDSYCYGFMSHLFNTTRYPFTDEICLYSSSASYFQGLLGTYVLTEDTYDDRSVWRNARLSGSDVLESYIFWSDADDMWIINSEIPAIAYEFIDDMIAYSTDGYQSPTQAIDCWYFADSVIEISDWTEDCDISLVDYACGSTTTAIAESDPPNVVCTNIQTVYTSYTVQLTRDDESGQWTEEDETYPYYLWFSDEYRLWIVSRATLSVTNIAYVCFDFTVTDPTQCDTWYHYHDYEEADIEFYECANATITTIDPCDYNSHQPGCDGWDDEDEDDQGMHSSGAGSTAGIVVGVLAAVFFLCICFFIIRKRSNTGTPQIAKEPPPPKTAKVAAVGPAIGATTTAGGEPPRGPDQKKGYHRQRLSQSLTEPPLPGARVGDDTAGRGEDVIYENRAGGGLDDDQDQVSVDEDAAPDEASISVKMEVVAAPDTTDVLGLGEAEETVPNPTPPPASEPVEDAAPVAPETTDELPSYNDILPKTTEEEAPEEQQKQERGDWQQF